MQANCKGNDVNGRYEDPEFAYLEVELPLYMEIIATSSRFDIGFRNISLNLQIEYMPLSGYIYWMYLLCFNKKTNLLNLYEIYKLPHSRW